MECFIKETFRLYPSAPVISREAASETHLANNLILPKGTQVVIHIMNIHQSSKYYENPKKFDPERFTPAASEGRHPFAFVPFSAGQRNCIGMYSRFHSSPSMSNYYIYIYILVGQKFAMLEVKTMLVNILKSFKILPLMKNQDIKIEAGLVIRIQNAVKVKLEKRV